MRYLYESGKRRRVMHLERFMATGEETFAALCGMRLHFNRSINVPLGRKTCKVCLKRAEEGM